MGTKVDRNHQSGEKMHQGKRDPPEHTLFKHSCPRNLPAARTHKELQKKRTMSCGDSHPRIPHTGAHTQKWVSHGEFDNCQIIKRNKYVDLEQKKTANNAQSQRKCMVKNLGHEC